MSRSPRLRLQSLIQAAAVTLSAASAAHAQQAVQWRVEDGGNGHWYQLRAAPLQSWADCAIQAQESGGSLATLTTPGENGFVVAAFAGSSTRYPWIGLSQAPDAAEPSTGWSWVTGEALSWSNWSPSEPNGDGAFDADQANLWLVEEPGRPRGTWNDWHTGGPDGFLVEWSADCNADGIVDYGQILQGQLPDTNTNGIPDGCECATSPTRPACCTGDLNRDRAVDGADLGILLNAWGTCNGVCPADLDHDGFVNGSDLGMLLGRWGPCSTERVP